MRKQIPFFFVIHLILMLSLQAQQVNPRFGDQGIHQTTLGEAALSDLSIQSWQKDNMLVSGVSHRLPSFPTPVYKSLNLYWAGALNSQGNPVSHFGQRGELYKDFGMPRYQVPFTLVDQEDRIVEFHHNNRELFIHRMHAHGELDSTFGDDGRLEIVIPSIWQFWLQGVLLKADGKILLFGSLNNGALGQMLIQLLENGEFDPTFGDGGISALTPEQLFPDNQPNTLNFNDLILLPNKDILIGGSASSSQSDGVLLRLKANGKIDPTLIHLGRRLASNILFLMRNVFVFVCFLPLGKKSKYY